MNRRLCGALTATVVALSVTACGNNGGDELPTGTLGTPATGPTEPTETTETTAPESTDQPDAGLEKPTGLSEPEDALADWILAFGANDGEAACDLQTEKYTRDLIKQSVDGDYASAGDSCAEVVEKVAEIIDNNGGIQPFGVDTSVETDNEATLGVTYEKRNAETYKMRLVNGDWLVDEEVR